MSAIEASISSCIFVAVVIMSFETMATGAKLSSATVLADEANGNIENALEDMDKEMRKGRYVITSYTGGGYTYQSNANEVAFIIPDFKDGLPKPDEYKIISYKIVPEPSKDGPFILLEVKTNVKNNKADAPHFDKIAKNVKEIKFGYRQKLSLTPQSGKFQFPTNITFGAPVGSQIQLLHLKSDKACINAGKQDKKIDDPGIKISELLSNGLVALGSDLVAVLPPPAGTILDATGRVNPGYQPNATKPYNLANLVTYRIVFTVKQKDDSFLDFIAQEKTALSNAE